MPPFCCLNKIKFCWSINNNIIRLCSSSKLYVLDKIKLKLDENCSGLDSGITSKSKVKLPHSMKHYNAVLEYFDSKQCSNDIVNKIPIVYMLRKYSSPKVLYIIDKDMADKMFEAMQPHLFSSNGYLLEVNAGVGLLTKRLLEANIPRLRIYESNSQLYKELKKLLAKYDSDARLIKLNLLLLWALIKMDENDYENRFGAAFEGMAPCTWESEPLMKIIITVSNKNFITQMIYSIIFQSGICMFGRSELFITMPSEEYLKLIAQPSHGFFVYRNSAVLFQLLFEHSLLTTVPEKVFVPWMIKYKRKRKTEETDGVMNLVKVTPRKDLFKIIPPHLLKPFWFFLRTVTHKRKAKLIPTLEKWIPGIGVKLIAMGFNIHTPIGSLNPEEYLKVFLEFSSCKEFSTCSFLPAMENVMIRLTNKGMVEQIVTEATKESKDEIDDGGDASVLVYDDVDLENFSSKER
uniref:rRNA adenine N(6)-methyltransferase n=1 Tax=Cuerna arida TaxID=1464854 RepID=A0A1B6EL97_9HEMI